jgi:hypothetical protein
MDITFNLEMERQGRDGKQEQSVGDNDDGILVGDMQVSILEKIVQGKKTGEWHSVRGKAMGYTILSIMIDHDR